MKVRTRLVVFGAVFPAVALLAAVLLAGWVFRRGQLAELDRRLLAQAAVESVSLFDGPGGAPHVHGGTSPIATTVKDFAPEAAIYDVRGVLVTKASDDGVVPPTVPMVGVVDEARISSGTVAGVARRILELPVRAPDGNTYTLWLGASFASMDATMVSFYRATLGAVAVLTFAMFGFQLVVARRLAARIDGITAFLPRLREGDTAIPADPVRDEIGTLRDTLRAVAVRLAEARAEQDRLLASAAHELRSPLTVMRTEIDLALRRERSPDELRDALRAARDEVVRLGVLASALLDLQAVRHLGYAHKIADLGSLVRDACVAFGGVAETTDIELRVDADGELHARFDELALRQAIDNLVANAIKHAPPGSIVCVSVARVGDRWNIAVADRGPGIPAEEVERVFEPFHRLANAPGSGAGLGLVIVREVAVRHGGRVWVDQAYTQGARIVLELATELTV